MLNAILWPIRFSRHPSELQGQLMLACTAVRAVAHLEAIGIQELGVVGGVGVVEAEGCHRVPGVVPLGKHAEVCQCCEELGHVCDCTPNGTTNVAVQLQWNDAGPALTQCSLSHLAVNTKNLTEF